MPSSSHHDIPSLQLVDVCKAYGPVRVLDQARISVRRGEVVALMGANGAGKSTLAKIAAGVVEPDNGQIFVAGKEVRLASPRIARQHGIVIVHQSTNELGAPGLSVAENLVLDDLCAGTFGTLAGKRKIKQHAKTVAAGIGLELDIEQDFGANFAPSSIAPWRTEVRSYRRSRRGSRSHRCARIRQESIARGRLWTDANR